MTLSQKTAKLDWKNCALDPTQRLPKKPIAAWTNNLRKTGRPQITYKNTYVAALTELLPNIQPDAPLNSWLPFAANPLTWAQYIKKWWDSKRTLILSCEKREKSTSSLSTVITLV